MNEKEIKEMQRRIDEGIRIAQERLWQRARRYGQTLVVVRDGKIVEFIPDGRPATDSLTQGDPLLQRTSK